MESQFKNFLREESNRSLLIFGVDRASFEDLKHRKHAGASRATFVAKEVAPANVPTGDAPATSRASLVGSKLPERGLVEVEDHVSDTVGTTNGEGERASVPEARSPFVRAREP